jgi:hypothetical protein
VTKFVGVCYDSGAWGGDLTGLLVAEDNKGWAVVSSHISSSEGWAKADIAGHFERRPEPSPDDIYEWEGLLANAAAIEARFGWAGVTT